MEMEMETEFVVYPLALRMKRIGFNKPCFGLYNPIKELCYPQLNYGEWKSFHIQEEQRWITPAPTWQSAFDWFSKEHNFHYAPPNGNLDVKSLSFQLEKLIENVEQKKEANTNDLIRFTDAINEYQKMYPSSNITDLETFAIGWKTANKSITRIIDGYLEMLHNQYNIPFQGYQAYAETNYAITQLEKVLSIIKEKTLKNI